jgi:hypothetical protein
MLASFKSEVRKILSIRSTYVILLMSLGLMVLFDFYVVGWHTPKDVFMNSSFLQNQIVNTVSFLSLITVIIVMLNVTHEYRYNTITYTLTSARRRTQVFVAKLLGIISVGAPFLIIAGVLTVLFCVLAAEVRGFEIGHQVWKWGDLGWRTFYGGLAYMMYAFILAMIIRVQVGAIVSFYLTFTMFENIARLVLKDNFVYLPFQAVGIMSGTGPSEAQLISPSRAAMVVSAYIVVGWMVSYVLFLRRDAN